MVEQVEGWLGQSQLKLQGFSLHRAQKSCTSLLIWFIVMLIFGCGNFLCYLVFYLLFLITRLMAVGWNTRCLSSINCGFISFFSWKSLKLLCRISAVALCPILLIISLVPQLRLSDIFIWLLELVVYVKSSWDLVFDSSSCSWIVWTF